MTNHANCEYWAEALQDNAAAYAPLLSKLYENHCNLSTEDQHLLRELLSQNAAMVNLLNSDLSKPAPKTRWQKITRK